MERPKKMILTGALVLAALTAAFVLLLRGTGLALVQALTAVALPEFLLLLGLVCTWRRVQRAALWCVGRLPNSEKWAGRKKKLRDQLEALYTESQALLRDRPRCGKVLALNAVKLFILFSIPYACMEVLKVPGPAFGQMQLLTALMFLITSVLPNVAGVGPAEFAFLLIFSPCVGEPAAALALVLYRAATYYAPFLVSALSFCTIHI